MNPFILTIKSTKNVTQITLFDLIIAKTNKEHLITSFSKYSFQTLYFFD